MKVLIDLKEKRLAKGYSPKQLAYAAGVSVDTIRRIEEGVINPRPDTVRWIKEALSGE